MEYWSIGVLEYWSIGVLEFRIPLLHHSSTPGRLKAFPFENRFFPIYFGGLSFSGYLKIRMKNFLKLIAIVSLGFGSCERHPASQLPKEASEESKEGAVKADESKSRESAAEPSQSGTPKTYFPKNSP
jgi:hypothetical protein